MRAKMPKLITLFNGIPLHTKFDLIFPKLKSGENFNGIITYFDFRFFTEVPVQLVALAQSCSGDFDFISLYKIRDRKT